MNKYTSEYARLKAERLAFQEKIQPELYAQCAATVELLGRLGVRYDMTGGELREEIKNITAHHNHAMLRIRKDG